jgi:hypothetical protein
MYEPPGALPAFYALGGLILLSIAAQFFLLLNEGPGTFIGFTLIFAVPGTYLLLAGAVARGIQMARKD